MHVPCNTLCSLVTDLCLSDVRSKFKAVVSFSRHVCTHCSSQVVVRRESNVIVQSSQTHAKGHIAELAFISNKFPQHNKIMYVKKLLSPGFV